MNGKKTFFFLLSASVLSGCHISSGKESSKSNSCYPSSLEERESLIIGTTSKIEKATRDEYAYDMLASGVSEIPLVSKDEHGEFSPLVADYKTEDSLHFTFTIKDGLKWSDGEAVTAKDLVFSLIYEETLEKPAFNTENKIGSYKEYVYSEDSRSVTLTLNETNVKFLEDLTTLRIRPEHIYDGKSEQQLTAEDKRVTCGPYKLAKFDIASQTLLFIENEYYPIKPNFKQLTYRLFSDEQVMYTALENKNLDFVWNYSMGVSKTYQEVLGKSSAVKLYDLPATNCPSVLLFNNKTGLFSDINLRFAVSYALDYDKFKSYFGSSYAKTPNRSFAPSSLIGFKETEKLSKNLSKAEEYMTKAGYAKKNGKWEKNGLSASFTLTVNSSKETHLGYADFVKTQLDAFGFTVNLETLDSTAFNAKTSNKFASQQGGNISMEASIMGFTAYGMKNLGDIYIDGHHPVQGGGQVFSDELDEIILNLNSSKTLTEYNACAGKLQDFYARETPAIALFWDSMIFASSSKLKNVSLDATFGINHANQWFSMTKEK